MILLESMKVVIVWKQSISWSVVDRVRRMLLLLMRPGGVEIEVLSDGDTVVVMKLPVAEGRYVHLGQCSVSCSSETTTLLQNIEQTEHQSVAVRRQRRSLNTHTKRVRKCAHDFQLKLPLEELKVAGGSDAVVVLFAGEGGVETWFI